MRHSENSGALVQMVVSSSSTADVFNRAIRQLLASLPAEVDAEWFEEATIGLAKAVGADIAMIGRIVDDGHAVETLGFCENRVLRPKIVYELEGTPCADVLSDNACVIPDNVADLYPDDQALRELRAAGYAGKPILDENSRMLGIATVLFRTPIRDVAALSNAFETFATGIAEKLREELPRWVDAPRPSKH